MPGHNAATAKSPIKWVGGKAKLTDELIDRTPERFHHYHEPFVGGGALFWALAHAQRLRKSYVSLSDTCGPLIRTWCGIKDDVDAVVKKLNAYTIDEKTFYKLRAIDFTSIANNAELAAQFIYLNKVGFNGLYRVNKCGRFNAPYGHWEKYGKPPNVCNEPLLRACSAVLKNLRVAVNERPFETVLHYAKKEDFVYFDPPYLPTSSTADFTSYSKDGFGYDDHVRLRDVARELKERGVYVMLSNADVPLARELYEAWSGFRIEVLKAPRSINSKAGSRGKVQELVIR